MVVDVGGDDGGVVPVGGEKYFFFISFSSFLVCLFGFFCCFSKLSGIKTSEAVMCIEYVAFLFLWGAT